MSRSLELWLAVALSLASCGPQRHLVGVDPRPDGSGGEASAPSAQPTRDTPLPDCPAYPTLGAMDGFFDRRCSGLANPLCHGQASQWTNLARPDLFSLLLDKEPNTDCLGSRLINSVSPLQSLLYIKSAQAMPVCPEGRSLPGTIMPPPPATAFADRAYPPLTQQEVLCVEQFVIAATTGILRR
jgi:hypothetical protein